MHGIIVGALVVAVVGFRVSWFHIQSYADHLNVFPEGEAWLAPILVDTLGIIASLAAIAWSRAGYRARYPWALVAVATGTSMLINVASAPPNLAARIFSLLAPVAALLSLGLVEQWYRYSRRAQTAAMAAWEARREAERKRAHEERMDEADQQVRLERAKRDTEESKAVVAMEQRMVRSISSRNGNGNGHHGPDSDEAGGPSSRERVQRAAVEARLRGERPTIRELAEETGVGPRQVQRYLAELRAEG
jgi:hypothetical protein